MIYKVLIISMVFLFINCTFSDKSVIRTFKYLENGDSILQLEYEVKNSEINGFYKVYYDNGIQKVESKYVDGLLNKIIFVKDRKGNRLDFGKLYNGSGCVRIYFDDTAIVKSEGCFFNGKFSGKWSNYNYNGKLIGFDFYKNGNLKDYGDFDFSYYH